MASFRDLSRASWGSEAWKALMRVRDAAPVVQCITDFSASMELMASAVMATGASPAMVHAVEEIREFTASRANAVCINVGTLSPEWLFSMKVAAAQAEELQKIWVLDPVGAGATKFRTAKCLELINLRPTVIRGNQMEIMALAGASASPNKDGSNPTSDGLEAAKELARISQSIVCVSGAMDLVTDGKRVLGVSNGVPMMHKITASGSAMTGLIAAFVSVHPPPRALEAAAFALAIFGLAGELGMEKASGPASLAMHLVDALHQLASEESLVTSRIKIGQI
ncbi:hypothetical protein SELMODRAFT_172611 [Selaginella moellendorffii]|uniref:hydroxyethylthiazole kinase n=1 Tax=Selaginella moellendorffii TaxID=88036 RepID=D8RM94_SELML|nr:hydroxyethylthiazole kinase [Selaginella moellendorffii]XP_002984122.1 hydroxyethylthiazole kinase [Selaginella moellendorffii]EFJ14632.1 hypothetical protein SELMODRAFT_119740 [Selaginella moellendorffii]EFJ26296.1 hypothetical protein SELMODRAFT_172611 [Selaginella moellendorffii]|eukprot:XP_002972210.1 hydroxyethylthiazole kinase [Selaginella moellendorffii]